MTLSALTPPPPVHLCGRKLESARHACCFFNGRDEEYAVLAPFVSEGLRQGEQVVQVVGRDLLRDHDERLRRAGVDTQHARDSGQYVVLAAEDAYLDHGHFDMERMLGTVSHVVHGGDAGAYPQVRATGNMEWALSDATGTERLVEYEARLNLISAHRHDPIVCFYDIQQFDAPTLLDIMRSHPAVVIGGVYHENPFYVPPEQMLQEIKARKPRRANA